MHIIDYFVLQGFEETINPLKARTKVPMGNNIHDVLLYLTVESDYCVMLDFSVHDREVLDKNKIRISKVLIDLKTNNTLVVNVDGARHQIVFLEEPTVYPNVAMDFGRDGTKNGREFCFPIKVYTDFVNKKPKITGVSRRQHFLSKTYLKNFQGEDGKITIKLIEEEKNVIKTESIESPYFWRDFLYGSISEFQPLEKWFSVDIERDYSTLLDNIINETFDNKNRQQLINFICTQLLRNPFNINRWKSEFTFQGSQVRPVMSNVDYQKKISDLLECKFNKVFQLYADTLATKSIQFWFVKGTSDFVSADRPVFLNQQGVGNGFTDPTHVKGNFFFPLTPHIAVRFHDGEKDTYHEVSDFEVINANYAVSANCAKFFFGFRKDIYPINHRPKNEEEWLKDLFKQEGKSYSKKKKLEYNK